MLFPPEGEPIPILVQLVSIVDGNLEEEEIIFSVRKIRTGQAGGPSGTNTEHLNTWQREATGEKYPDTEKWDKLVSIKKLAFQDRYIPEALTWMTRVLILKIVGGYIGIGLVEVI